MDYNRGVRIRENATSFAAPVLGTAGLQVAVGVSPVNLAEDPYHATNVAKIAYSLEEASAAVGFSGNLKDYNLNQSISATFKMFAVAPIILVNVLDPERHKASVEKTECTVQDMQAVLGVEGMLLDKVVVEHEGTELKEGTDYIVSFDGDGYVVATLLEDGSAAEAKKLLISGVRIDPSLVEAKDIIGGYDAVTGKESGMELIRQVYPLFGMVPGIITSPGYSRDPDVAAVMAIKCLGINGVFTCECIVDIDCTAEGAMKYTDVKAVKDRSGLASIHMEPVWPKVRAGDEVYYYSAVFSAMVAYIDAANDDVPNLHMSNKALPITGLCLDDEGDTEVVIDRKQANRVNSFGVVTAVNINGFRSWGNNTAAYPETKDPKDRWFGCRRFFSWWGNSFILTYDEKVDDPANYRLVESICDAENIRGNSYATRGKCAGARIVYIPEENTTEDILDGKVQFRQYLAPYTPAEDILNVLEFDPSMLAAALSGGE